MTFEELLNKLPTREEPEMTFEAFKDMAINPDYPKRQSVYRLDIHRYQIPRRTEKSVGQFEVQREQSFLYPSLEAAHIFIRRFITLLSMNRQLYALYLYELPYNVDISNDLYIRLWVYDRTGKIVSQSCCSNLIEDMDAPYAKFRGRDKDSIKFKRGDIVEVYNRESKEVIQAVVLSLPPTIEQCWKYRQLVERECIKEGLSADDTDSNYWFYALDDCFEVMDISGNIIKPLTTDVFPTSLPVYDSFRTYLSARFVSKSEILEQASKDYSIPIPQKHLSPDAFRNLIDKI